jgi:hypothetical protein
MQSAADSSSLRASSAGAPLSLQAAAELGAPGHFGSQERRAGSLEAPGVSIGPVNDQPHFGITEVEVKGFRSARDVSFSPGPVCALVGEANAGKSNLIAAIRSVLDPAIILVVFAGHCAHLDLLEDVPIEDDRGRALLRPWAQATISRGEGPANFPGAAASILEGAAEKGGCRRAQTGGVVERLASKSRRGSGAVSVHAESDPSAQADATARSTGTSRDLVERTR